MKGEYICISGGETSDIEEKRALFYHKTIGKRRVYRRDFVEEGYGLKNIHSF